MTTSLVRALLLAVSILGLGACESPPASRVLTKPEQAALGSVDAVLWVPNAAPRATVRPTDSPGAGGLMGAFVVGVVDGVRTASAQSEAAPLIATLQGREFQTDLLTALKGQLEALKEVKVLVRPSAIAGDNISVAERAYEESIAPSFLLMELKFKLVSGDLELRLVMTLYPKSEELKRLRPRPNDKQAFDKGNALLHVSPVVIQRSDVIAADLRAAIDQSIALLARTAAANLGYTP